MANVNAPRGLIPWRYRSGAPYNGAANVYYLPTGESNNIFVGDPVAIAGSADGRGIPTATLATAGATHKILGPMVAIVNAGTPPVPVLQNSTVYRVASVATYILVADDPFLMHMIQEDSVSANIAATDVGANINLASGSGSTVTGYSGWTLDSDSIAADATYQATLLRMLDEEDNAIGQYARWLVSLNIQSFVAGVAGT